MSSGHCRQLALKPPHHLGDLESGTDGTKDLKMAPLTSVRASRFAACQQSRLSSDFGGNVEGVAAGQAAGAGSRLFMAFHSDSLKKFGARKASGRRSDRLRIVHPSMY